MSRFTYEDRAKLKLIQAYLKDALADGAAVLVPALMDMAWVVEKLAETTARRGSPRAALDDKRLDTLMNTWPPEPAEVRKEVEKLRAERDRYRRIALHDASNERTEEDVLEQISVREERCPGHCGGEGYFWESHDHNGPVRPMRLVPCDGVDCAAGKRFKASLARVVAEARAAEAPEPAEDAPRFADKRPLFPFENPFDDNKKK